VISARSGLPGAGKTYGAVVDIILPALAKGRAVYTNVPMLSDRVALDHLPGELHLFTPDDFVSHQDFFNNLPPGAVIVLDEVWRVWPSGLRTLDVPQSHRSFLAEHRHKVDQHGNSTEIVLITQDLSQIAAFARQLVETTSICTKLSAVGIGSRFRIDTYQGSITGRTGPKSRLVAQAVVKYNSKFFDYYKSHTQSVAGLSGKEIKVDRRALIWKSPFFIVGALFVVLAGVLGYRQLHSFFSGRQLQPPHAEVAGRGPISSPGSIQKVVSPAPAPGPVYSDTWRLGGVISGFSNIVGGGYALVETADGVIRHIPLLACHLLPGNLDWACTVDGQLVTSWSGTQPQQQYAPSSGYPPCSTSAPGVKPGPIGATPACFQNVQEVDVTSSSSVPSPARSAHPVSSSVLPKPPDF